MTPSAAHSMISWLNWWASCRDGYAAASRRWPSRASPSPSGTGAPTPSLPYVGFAGNGIRPFSRTPTCSLMRDLELRAGCRESRAGCGRGQSGRRGTTFSHRHRPRPSAITPSGALRRLASASAAAITRRAPSSASDFFAITWALAPVAPEHKRRCQQHQTEDRAILHQSPS